MSDSSSGQIIGGVIGAVLTFIPGVNIAAGVGFAIGAAIGGAIGAEDQTVTGPRRDDLKVQASSYGRPLPFTYGTVPIAGNVIWLENERLKEVKESEEVGKGGGGTTQETFTYYATFAVTLCEGPIGGIRRIWADADLIYDHSTDAKAGTLFGGSTVMVSGDDLGGGTKIVIYRGTQGQRPHGRIEADKGAAPAYRGTAYIVIEDFPLDKYGNRIPSITAEVVTPSVDDSRPTLVDIVRPAWPGVSGNALDYAEDFARVIGETLAVNVNPDDPSISSDDSQGNVDYIFSVDGDLLEQRGKPHRTPTNNLSDAYAGEWATTVKEPAHGGDGQKGGGFGTYEVVYHVFQNKNGLYDVDVYVPDSTDETDGLKRVHRWPNDGGSSLKLVAVITPDRQNLYLIRYNEDGNENVKFERYDAATGFLVAQETGSFVATSGGPLPGSIGANGDDAPIAIESGGQRAWWIEQNDRTLFERDSNGNFAVVNRVADPNPDQEDPDGSFNDATVMADKGMCWIFYKDYLEIWTAQSLIDAQAEPLQHIVEDLTTRAGLAAGEVDATALDDDVRGYTMSRVSPVRAPLSQLRMVFPFDIRQNGYTLEFVPRGGSPVATLTDADLGAREVGQEAPAIVRTERVLETQMPRRIHLAYEDFDREYEAGNQYADRIVTASERVVREDLPIVLTATEAAKAVDVMLRDAWANQETHHVQASRPQLPLQPADVVTLDTAAVQGTARLTQLDDGRPGLLKIRLAPDDTGIYDSDAAGDTGAFPGSTISVGGPTLYELMDLPALRDQDRGGGFYLAMAGQDGWPGGQLFRSDSGDVFNTRTASVVAATLGHTIGALGDGPTTIWDRGNTLSVTIGAGSLASKTEAEVLNGANRAAISTTDGWEIIGFADAVLEADGSYTLSTLLRGLRGTERATVGHGDRDRFVVLTSNGSIQRVDRSLDSIGTQYVYKAVTIGQSLLTATARAFTYTGENLKPYSPVHPRGARDGAGDVTISWTRRTRIGGAWRDNTGAPLSEETESYEVDVMNGSTVVRTLSSTGPSVTYTAAQQITDFGAVQPGVTVRIYQISAEVGRGHKAEATL